MGKLSGSRTFGMMSALLAFALSAALGLAFVMVVNKTHDLFAGAASEPTVPSVAASTAGLHAIGGKVGLR